MNKDKIQETKNKVQETAQIESTKFLDFLKKAKTEGLITTAKGNVKYTAILGTFLLSLFVLPFVFSAESGNTSSQSVRGEVSRDFKFPQGQYFRDKEPAVVYSLAKGKFKQWINENGVKLVVENHKVKLKYSEMFDYQYYMNKPNSFYGNAKSAYSYSFKGAMFGSKVIHILIEGEDELGKEGYWLVEKIDNSKGKTKSISKITYQ
jgi:hypothetical protein